MATKTKPAPEHTPLHDPKHHPEERDGRPSNLVKDPHNWTTGAEPMTDAQASYLQTLSEEAKEEFDPELTKADASLKIDELQAKTGRGQGTKREA